MFNLYKDMYTLYNNNYYLLKCIKTSNQTQKVRTFHTDCQLQMQKSNCLSQIFFVLNLNKTYIYNMTQIIR